jgi:hypothetical protein
MFTQIMSFAMAIASRGFSDSKIDLPTKKLRYISCFGNAELPKCSKLKKSDKSEFYYCGGCNCGDHSHTWLVKNEGEYSKLDYPKLNCPLKMPGFTNYDPNNPKQDLDRKKIIENMSMEKLNFVNVTVSVDKEKEELFEKIQSIKNKI